MTDTLFPAAIVCSCGKRFESEWSSAFRRRDDTDSRSDSARHDDVVSALWLFLRHQAARLASRSGERRAHNASAIHVRCFYCSDSIDIGRYQRHLHSAQCSADAKNVEKRYAQCVDNDAGAPRYKLPCDECDESGSIFHSHGTFFRPMRGNTPVETYLCCRDCRCHVPMSDAVGHAAFWHPERIGDGSRPSVIADLYVTNPARPPIDATTDDNNSSLISDADTFEFALPAENGEEDANPDSSDSALIESKQARLFECEVCASRFLTEQDVERHTRLHAPARPFRCSTCGNSFLCSDALFQHIKRHTEQRSVQCPECDKTLADKRGLAVHIIAVHRKERPYPCRLCDKRFGTTTARGTHENSVHTHRRAYTCQYCARVCFGYSSHQDHVRRYHTKEKPFACSQCDAAFIGNGDLKRHSVVHSDAQPYRCTESDCDRRFKTRKGVRVHVDTFHLGKSHHAVPPPCGECGRILSSRRALADHLRAVHRKERPFACQHCDMRFGTSTARASHTNLHTRARTYTCDYCSKEFYAWSNHQTHVQRVHTLEKPHRCPHCPDDRRFTTRTDLARHLLVHSDATPHRCTEPGCEKSFKLKKTRKRHIDVVHRGIRPFECEECGRGFCKSARWRRHLLRHGASGQVSAET